MNARKPLVAICLLLASLVTTGCATFANHKLTSAKNNAEILNGKSYKENTCVSPQHLYRGTITDVIIIRATSTSLIAEPSNAILAIPIFLLSTIDLPLSFVADTVILPITVARQLTQCLKKKKKKHRLSNNAVTTFSAVDNSGNTK